MLEAAAIEGNEFIFLGPMQGFTGQRFCGADFSYLVPGFDMRLPPTSRKTSFIIPIAD